MKPFKLIAASLIVVIAFLISCQKEFLGEITVPIGATPNITTSVSGRIVDEQNKPVMGATVKVGSATTTTTVNGEFNAIGVNVNDNAAFVQVSKQGYFTGSRTFVAQAGAQHYIEVKLLPNQSVGTINNTTGGTVAIANGTSVTLPATSVVVASTNAAYSGNINVSLAWIDPTSPNLTREMPGDLRGINVAGAEMGLESYGMVAVELTGAGGEKLQIASGKKATVKFFLPAAIASAAPAQIALWSFNDTTGLWKQEGTASKSGSYYTAEVSHFSFWNCDAPFPVVDFTATIKDQTGQPLKHKLVKIKRTAVNQYTTGFTDSLGVVKGKVPSNEPLVLEVTPNYTCNTVLHTQNIGPFASAANINVTVTVNPQQVSIINGTATTCTGTPLVNGTADLIINQQTYRATVTNGAFSFSVYTCSNNQTASLVVTDLATQQQSAPTTLTVTTGTNNAGSISACGTSINQFINYTLNGTAYTLIPPADSLQARLLQQPTRTSISGFSLSQGANRQISFTFSSQAVGTAPITALFASGGNSNGSLATNQPASANITEYGQPGGFIAGSFTASIRDSSAASTVVPVQGTFRVRRNL